MDGVYHPLWAAFPNNPTLRVQTLVLLLPISRPYGALTLFGMPFQVNFGLRSSGSGQFASPDHNSPDRNKAGRKISDLGLFPLRSPLLRESLLVSLPPLIDMLKFSGWVSLDLRPQFKNFRRRRSAFCTSVKRCTHILADASQRQNAKLDRQRTPMNQCSHTRCIQVRENQSPLALNVAPKWSALEYNTALSRTCPIRGLTGRNVRSTIR